MELTDLVPQIEIGKEYLWTSFPIELLCEKCGANLGNYLGDFSFKVIVIATSSDFVKSSGLLPHCAKCGYENNLNLEGWYAVRNNEDSLHNEIGNVPYTQLHLIKEEN